MLTEPTIHFILDFLQKNLISYKENLLLKYETYFKSGGIARIHIEPNHISQIYSLIIFLRNSEIDFKIIGSTSNIYFLDELKYGVIISTRSLTSLTIQNKILEVETGYQLEGLVRVALINDFIGFEGLEGIPGSIGGAIFMNAGAYGYSISDKLISVTVLNEKNEFLEISKQEAKFKHRSSIFKQNPQYIILSAKFSLEVGNQNAIAEKIRTYHIARHSYQEFAYPNLGSIFSVQGDFYREIFRENKMYKIKCILLKIFLRNSISKLFMRKNPNNKLLNTLTIKYLNLKKIYLPVSEKSINILINDGKSSFFQKYEHVNALKKYLKKSTPLENEFVFSPLMEDKNNVIFLEKYQELLSQ